LAGEGVMSLKLTSQADSRHNAASSSAIMQNFAFEIFIADLVKFVIKICFLKYA
jgi:hypothetical protein